MNNMIMSKIFSVFLGLFIFTNVFGQDNACWPSFRGNASLTGYTGIDCADSYKLLWSFNTDDEIKSSPVICDGTIYIGSDDGNLYAISDAGKLIWKYSTESS
nr:PQQ-binding-like beta-propeller repeat protein [Bacteroidota bacterium]